MTKLRGIVVGVPVTVDFWLMAMVLAVLLTQRGLLFWYFLLPVLLHESGHLLAMALCGAKIEAIACTAFSIDIQRGGQPMGLGKEMFIALAGIITNGLVAVGLYFFAFPSLRVMLFTMVNVAVALFNLAPIGDLDGGQVLRIILSHTGSHHMAYAVSRWASFLLLAPLFGVGIYLVLQDMSQFSLLLVCLYLAGRVLASRY